MLDSRQLHHVHEPAHDERFWRANPPELREHRVDGDHMLDDLLVIFRKLGAQSRILLVCGATRPRSRERICHDLSVMRRQQQLQRRNYGYEITEADEENIDKRRLKT